MRNVILPCLALAWFLTLPASVPAQTGPELHIEQVRVGFPTSLAGDACKAGFWAPVYVEVKAGAEPINAGEAMLVVETSDPDEVQNEFSVRLPPLEPDETRTVLGYVKPGNAYGDLGVRIRGSDGRLLAEARREGLNFEAQAPASILYLTLGSSPARLGAALKPEQQEGERPPSQIEESGGRLYAQVNQVEQLPTRWFGYDAVDVLILTTGNLDFIKGLLEDQQNRKEALAEWVRRGGRLVISVGRNQQFAAELLARLGLLDCNITGTVQRKALTSLRRWTGATEPFIDPRGANLDIARLEPGSGVSVLAEEPGIDSDPVARPVVVQGASGLGRVLLVAFDLDQPPFTTWEGQTSFWRKVQREMEPRVVTSQRGGMGQPGIGWGGDNQELGTQLSRSLELFEEVSPISFGWVALFILLYIIVVGPLDYLFLKKVAKRLELTWITFPAVVLVVSAVAYVAAYSLKGNELRINKVDVVDIDLRHPQVCSTTWFTLFSPHIKNYTVGIEPAAPDWVARPGSDGSDYGLVVSWMGRPEDVPGGVRPSGAQSLFTRSYEYAPEATGLLGVPVQVWSTKAFTASWQAPLSGDRPLFQADLHVRRDPEHVSGTITSGLPGVLEEAALIYRGRYYPLGNLVPEVPRRVDDLGIGSGRGQPLDNWFRQPFAGSGLRAPPSPRSPGDYVESPAALMKALLFHEIDPSPRYRNSALRQLDQGWRLREQNDQELILVGHLPARKGPAEEVTQDQATPSRLWLGGLPGTGQERPSLGGTLSQETYVRVYIPLARKP